MAIIGVVKGVVGQVFAVAADGARRLLVEGDRVFTGEEVLTGASGAITIELPDGRTLDVGRESRWGEVAGLSEDRPASGPGDDIEALQQAIADGADPTDPTSGLEATAAGAAAAGEAGEGGGSHTAVVLDLTGERVVADPGYPTEGISVEFNNSRETLGEPESGSSSFAAILTLTAPQQIVEGEPITYTLTVNSPVVGSPLVVTLTNGVVITIPVGATSGTGSIPSSRPDDSYRQADDVLTVGIGGTTGGNYSSLNTSSTTTTTVVDDSDETTVSLTATPSVNENGTVTYTASLTNPAQGDVTVTLSNGQTITIPDGATSGSVDYVAGNDIYNGAPDLSVAITDATGGNFETLVVDPSPANTVVDDTVDTTTLTLGDVTVDEGSGTATISATLSNPTDRDFTVTLDNGATITFTAGSSTAVSTPFSVQGDDVYVDGESYVVSVSDAGAHNFEGLDSSDTATVTINDTIDTTTVAVSTTDVTEDDAGVTFKFQLSNPPQAGTPATLSVDVGGTAYTVVVDASGYGELFIATQDSDVYVDPSSLTATVAAIDGGNFEATDVTGATATAQISDTIDTTTLTLGDVTVDEGSGTATISATLSNPTDRDFTVTLDNGATITFTAGSSTAVSTPFSVQGDDVYVDGESYVVSVSDAGAHNFESLDSSDTATVTINDTIDTTTVAVSTTDVTEDDAGVTFKFQLSNPPQAGTPATLSVDVGGTAYTVVVDASGYGELFIATQDSDVYVDPSSLTATVTAIDGGNFEATDVAGATATAQISDTIDTTTLTLGDVTVDEGSGTATISATLSNPTDRDFTVTLDNGATITFTAGSSTAVSTPFSVQGDDVYVDGESYVVSVSDAGAHNFESLDSSDTATVTINDTIDTTAVVVSTTDVTEDDAGVTFKFQLSNPPQAGTPATLSVDVGGTAYTVVVDASGYGELFIATQDSDVYVDPSSLTATVTAIDGGNFEATDVTGATATAQISDTIDSVTVKLTATASTSEDGGSITYTASLVDANNNPVTTNNAISVTL
ncbi:retention module-containing protein, partial [Stutzerimonas kirkiae]